MPQQNNEFTPTLPKFPMTPRQFAEQEERLQDPEYVGSLTANQIMQLRAERQQYYSAQEEQKSRFKAMGLTDAQIDYLDKVALESDVDPNDPEMRAQILQEMQRDTAGIAEGAKQALEGVGDFAMDLSQELNVLTRGVAGDDEAAKQAWKDGVRQRRVAAAEEHLRTFGQLPGKWSGVVGEMVPWLAATTGQASRYTYFVARNAMLGGVAGSSFFQEDEKELADRWMQGAFGTAIGAGVGTVFGFYPWLKRGTAKAMVRRFNEADSMQREYVEGLVQEMTGNPEFRFSAAQLTGARFWANLESASADKLTHAQQVRNTDILVNHTLDLARQQAAAGRTSGQIAGSIRTSLKAARDQMYAQATSMWGSTSEQIIRLYGDDAILRGRDYLSKIDSIIEQETNALTNMGGKPSGKLLKYRDEVDKIVNPNTVQVENAGTKDWKVYLFDRKTGERGHRVLANTEQEARAIAQQQAFNANEAIGGPTAEETFKILAGLNRMLAGDVPLMKNAPAGSNKNLGRALMGAFSADLQASGSNKAAVGAINSLRNMYRADMAAIQALDDTVISAVFGGTKWRKGTPQALDRILAQEPADMVATRRFLEEHAPDTLDELRRYALRRAVSKGQQSPAAGEIEGKFSIERFAEALADKRGREGMFASGLWDPKTAQEIKRTADALRILANKQYTGIIPGGTRPEEWTINIISRSPEFFGRFLTRMFASGQSLEQAVLDPAWRHAVRIIADEKNLKSPAGKTALFYLTNLMVETEERRKAEQAAAEEQQKAEAMRVAP